MRTKLTSLLRTLTITPVLVAASVATAAGADPYCMATDHKCDRGSADGVTDESPAYPVTSEDSLLGFTLNPASIPVRDALGIAAIYYKVKPQFLFVKGAGRIGAAISPSNADDTFFGNPALETDADYLYRRQESVPFEQTKVALGLAVSPIDNGGAGWSRFQVTLGALGRYIAATEQVKPGGGVTIAAGPLTLGAALTMDETRVGTRLPQEEKTVESKTTSLTAGLSFGSLLLDYTKLTSLTTSDLDTGNEMHVDLATMSVLLNRFVITGAYRIEHSARGGYEGKTRSLFAKPTKEEIFAGVQFAILPFSQVGVFYNYFLLNEVSAGLTIFF